MAVISLTDRGKLCKLASKARKDAVEKEYTIAQVVVRVTNDVLKFFDAPKDIPIVMFKRILSKTDREVEYYGKLVLDDDRDLGVMEYIYGEVAYTAKMAGIEKLKRPMIKSLLKSLFRG